MPPVKTVPSRRQENASSTKPSSTKKSRDNSLSSSQPNLQPFTPLVQPSSFLPIISQDKTMSKRLKDFEGKVAMIESANQGILQQILKTQAELKQASWQNEQAIHHESKARKILEGKLKSGLDSANVAHQQSSQSLSALLNEFKKAEQKEMHSNDKNKNIDFDL